MRAVRFWMAAFATGAVAPQLRPGTHALADEPVVLTPEGAAYLAAQATPQTRYDAICPARADGCGESGRPARRALLPPRQRRGPPARPGRPLRGGRGPLTMDVIYWNGCIDNWDDDEPAPEADPDECE